MLPLEHSSLLLNQHRSLRPSPRRNRQRQSRPRIDRGMAACCRLLSSQRAFELGKLFGRTPSLLADDLARDFSVAIDYVRFGINGRAVILRYFRHGALHRWIPPRRKNNAMVDQKFLI